MLSPNDPAVYILCVYSTRMCMVCIVYKYIKRHTKFYIMNKLQIIPVHVCGEKFMNAPFMCLYVCVCWFCVSCP